MVETVSKYKINQQTVTLYCRLLPDAWNGSRAPPPHLCVEIHTDQEKQSKLRFTDRKTKCLCAQPFQYILMAVVRHPLLP